MTTPMINSPEAASAPGQKVSTVLFDADIHPNVSQERIARRLPQPWRRRFEEGNRGPAGLGYWNPNGVQRLDTILPDGRDVPSRAEWLGEYFLDAYGIDYGILNYLPGYVLSPELDFGASVVSATNDVLIEDWLQADRRLRASMIVHPFEPKRAAQEIRRVGGNPGIVQILMPSASPLPYGQRMFDPVYEAAQEMGLPIAIHPGSEGVGLSGAPNAFGYPSNYLEWHTGLITSYVTQLLSVVTEGVFQKFPGLRLVLVEGGVSWLPAVLWRFDKNWKALRQLTPWLQRPPSEVITEHVLLTTQPLEEPARREHLRQILNMFDSATMLMFSTDYPHWDGDTPDFTGIALPAEIRARVMGETAAELYGIEPGDTDV